MPYEKEQEYRDMIQRWRFTAITHPITHSSQLANNLHLYRHQAPGITDADALAIVLLTFDVGHHACGWWKNADYDRCLHLSLSIGGARKGSSWKYYDAPEEVTDKELQEWARLVFAEQHQDAMKWLWFEPGYQTKTVQHLRLFYSKLTGQAIMPQGEVYNLKPWGDGSDPEKIFNRCGM